MRISDEFYPVRIQERDRTRLLIPILIGKGMTEMLKRVAKDKAHEKLDTLGRLCLGREMFISVTASVQNLKALDLVNEEQCKRALEETTTWFKAYTAPLLAKLQKKGRKTRKR